MSEPTVADFAIIKIGDGDSPEEFTILCGIDNVAINTVATTVDRFRRDCEKPGLVPFRFSKTTGRQQDISGSGMPDKDQIGVFLAALGVTKNYQIDLLLDNDTDEGELLGTFSGAYKMTAANINVPQDAESSAEIQLQSQGEWTWEPVTPTPTP